MSFHCHGLRGTTHSHLHVTSWWLQWSPQRTVQAFAFNTKLIQQTGNGARRKCYKTVLRRLLPTCTPPHMPSKCRSIAETSSTFLTGVRTFSTVHEGVHAQLVCSSETPWTDATCVTAFIRMDHHVVPQRAALCECCWTDFAPIRTISSVDTTVNTQVTKTLKPSMTLGANMRPGITVGLLMLTQQIHAAKCLATHRTWHSHGWRVTSLVSIEAAGISKAATTFRTKKWLFMSMVTKMTVHEMPFSVHQTTYLATVTHNTPWRRCSLHTMCLQVLSKQRCRGKWFRTVSTNIRLAGSMTVMYVPHQVAQLCKVPRTMWTDERTVSSVYSGVNIQSGRSWKLLATIWAQCRTTRFESATSTLAIHCTWTSSNFNSK